MQRKQRFIVSIIILIGLLTTVGGILGSLATNALSQEVRSYYPYVWLLLGAVTLAGIGLTVWQYRLQADTEHSVPMLDRQKRQRMLEKVRTFWITGMLEQSLHGAVLIALGLQEQPDALADPWRLVLRQSGQASRPLPPDTRIIQVYDAAAGELLILGEPGSGKTTLLLELTRTLLERATHDEVYPLPVVFHLSSWREKRQPFTDWLVEELNSKYQVPRKLGQSWVNADQVLPLLDGLDEVNTTYRAACIDAINVYRREHGLIPMVVCSRSADYLTMTTRLLLRNAVVIQPPTAQQIDTYLSGVGGPLAAVRLAYRTDPALQKLITTPLMLSVLTLAYQGLPVEGFLAVSPSIHRHQIFATYVQRMLQRRSTETHYTRQQTIYWLAWLAGQMIQHNEIEFTIKQMRVDWLPDNRLRRFCNRIIVGLVDGFVFGSLFGSLVWLLIGGGEGPVISLVFGLFVGLISGLMSAYASKEPDELLSDRLIRLTIRPLYERVLGRPIEPMRRLVDGIVFGLLIWLLILIFSGLFNGWWSFGPSIGLAFGLLCGLAFELMHSVKEYTSYLLTRLFLWHGRYTPWNYLHFLNYAVECSLLRKIGDRYIFIHRMLLDYFATLDSVSTSQKLAEHE